MNTVRRQPRDFMNTSSAPALPGSPLSHATMTMKTRPAPARRLRPALVVVRATLAVVLLGSSRLLAQATPTPPERLTYQGFLVDHSQ